MSRFCIAFSAILTLFLCHAGPISAQTATVDFTPPKVQTTVDPDSVEIFRLRIVNRKDGAIQVSSNAGAQWRLIGRVLSPATTAAEGYTAAQYAAPGTVAAIAVHGLRLRVGGDDPTVHDPLVLSIDPVEFGSNAQDVDKGYGGQITGSAGILTDIHAGTSIFRDLAPMVGNTVSMERPDGTSYPVGAGFHPTGTGETLVITVMAPRNSLTQVTFDNHTGGDVVATFADGSTQTVTHVVQPLSGVGRFDGTAFTGVGRVNTDHTGVITIATSPIDNSHVEGTGREIRGGFQISPAWHNARLEEAGAPMVMTLGDATGPRKRELEATAPLFKSDIGLGSASDPSSALCDVSVDGGDWEPMPTLIGNLPNAFTATGLTAAFKAAGSDRVSAKGVTAFRLRFAPLGVERAKQTVAEAVDAYRLARYTAATARHLPIVHDTLTVNANPTDTRNVAYVRLLIEDTPRGVTNVAPFSLSWNTRTVPDGEYLVEADALNSDGEIIAVTRRKVFVLNHEPPHAPAATTDKPAAGVTRDGSAAGG